MDDQPTTPPPLTRKRFLGSLYLTELVLVLLSLGVARLVEGRYLPFAVQWSAEALLLGLLSAVPLALLILLASYGPVSRITLIEQAMNRITDRLRQVLGASIRSLTAVDIVLLSLAAGVAEELFFRGLLQSYIGVIGSALVFGLLHALTPAYFVMATAIGLYFGYLYEIGGNLLIPMAGHAMYDIFALYLLQWQFKKDTQKRL
jgi:membrane protease YdiL (CAAX protease family)